MNATYLLHTNYEASTLDSTDLDLWELACPGQASLGSFSACRRVVACRRVLASNLNLGILHRPTPYVL